MAILVMGVRAARTCPIGEQDFELVVAGGASSFKSARIFQTAAR